MTKNPVYVVGRRQLMAGVVAVLASSATPAIASDDAGAAWKPVIQPAELAVLSAERAPLILDIRGKANPKGPWLYKLGHVPGAVSAPYSLWRGPKNNPGQPLDARTTQTLLRSLGAEKDRPTVVVHQGANATDFGAAARVYWTLKTAGVAEIAILNGGVNGWLASGRPLSVESPTVSESDIEVTFDPTWTATREDVKAATLAGAAARLIDARPLAFFRGEAKHKAAKKAGTLTNATQLSQDVWFPRGSAQIGDRKAVLAALRTGGYSPKTVSNAVSFCNTGHWAATNWFALSEIAGVDNVKLYPESLVGWTGADLPVVPGGDG